MAELGQIENPGQKALPAKENSIVFQIFTLYMIRLMTLKELFDRYWNEVDQQIEKLEAAGKVKKIFCEMVYTQKEEIMEILGRFNERVRQIVKKKVEEGGTLLPLEDKEIFGPYIDWGNCLRVVSTQEVFTKILDYYTELATKRLQHILSMIDKNLGEEEAGLLILKDEDRAHLQFPGDIEVFLVTPPSYDDITRWFREKWKEMSEQQNPQS
jgi:hypothetical protein